MKKLAIWGICALAVVAGAIIAADHLDAPAVANSGADIADFYAFEGEDPNSTVFIVTLPAENSASNFDENVLIEINIDNTGVQGASPGVVEDLVIQCLRQGNRMYFFGPYAPTITGLTSTIDTDQLLGSVIIGDNVPDLGNGVKAYAGHRQDAFFFDFEQFNTVVGTAPAAGFGSTGTNTFASANVNAIILELPNDLLGTAPTHIVDQLLASPTPTLPAAYNVWVETKRR
ncbi:MAG: DUF4331 family protein [Nonlabens sp.]